jgi:ABC-type phosphate transport system substrate-binding protein
MEDFAKNSWGGKLKTQGKIMNPISRSLLLSALSLVLIAGCGPKQKVQESTPTSGSAFLYVSTATQDLTSQLDKTFEAFYPDARIDIAPLRTRAAVESLLFGRQQQIILDRSLTAAESVAAADHNVPIYPYPLAAVPLYFAVNEKNTVRAIDSVALRNYLTGEWDSWKEAGGPDIACHPYMPLPGEGGWEAFMNYFGFLDTVIAVVCSTETDLITKAEADPGALAVVSVPIAKTHLTKLWWRTGSIEIPPNIKTIVDEPRYPFKLTITYITDRQKQDVAAGFLTFIVSNSGQKVVADQGYRPMTIPVRIVEMY